MKKSELLEEALKYLQCPENRGKEQRIHSPFVCNALNCVYRMEKHTPELSIAVATVQHDIIALLHPATTVADWLQMKGHRKNPKGLSFSDYNKQLDQIQSYRYAWMKHLAAEYRAKGE